MFDSQRVPINSMQSKITEVYLSSDFQIEFGKRDLELPCFSSVKVKNDLCDSTGLQMIFFIGGITQ